MEKKGEKYAENRKGRGFYQKVLSAKIYSEKMIHTDSAIRI